MFDVFKIEQEHNVLLQTKHKLSETKDIKHIQDKLCKLTPFLEYSETLKNEESFNTLNFNQFGPYVLTLPKGVYFEKRFLISEPNVVLCGFYPTEDGRDLNNFIITKQGKFYYGYFQGSTTQSTQLVATTRHFKQLLNVVPGFIDSNNHFYDLFQVSISGSWEHIFNTLAKLKGEIPIPQHDEAFNFCEDNVHYLRNLQFI